MHKVEMRHQENGEAEEELVVSNLRPFTLKERTAPHRCPPCAPFARTSIAWRVHHCCTFPPLLPRAGEQPPSPGCAGAQVGVHDALDMPILDCALPLRASLLYENGLPVKQARPLASGTERGGGAAAQVSPAPLACCVPRRPHQSRCSSARRTSSRCKVAAAPPLHAEMPTSALCSWRQPL